MSRVIKIPRLKKNRHGVYCLRYYHRTECGTLKEISQSLGTKEPQQARILALRFNAAFEEQRANEKMNRYPKFEIDLSRGVMKADGPEDYDRMLQAFELMRVERNARLEREEAERVQRLERGEPEPVPKTSQKKFSEIVRLYLEERKLDNTEKTRIAKKRTYDDLKYLVGDLLINGFSKSVLLDFKNQYINQGLKPQSINSRLGELNDLFNWSINNGYYTASDKSPVDGLRIGTKSTLALQRESYEPFSNDEIEKIFGDGYLKKFDKPDFYYVPLLALFSGARREELAALKAENIKKIDGVYCFHIETGKTVDARRIVPIHQDIIDIGFLDYAKSIQNQGFKYLFPYLTDGHNGKGKNVGRQFSNWLSDVGISDSRKVFHSFRHTVITRLHSMSANAAHVMQIVGHSSETQGVHFQTYTHDVGLRALSETLGRLNYSLDFKKLKPKDSEFKTYIHRWKMQEERKAYREKMAFKRDKLDKQ